MIPGFTLQGVEATLFVELRRIGPEEHELTGLYQSVRTTTLTLDLPEVMNRLTEATAQALECKGVAIRLLDKTGSCLEMVAAHGLSETYWDKSPIEMARARIPATLPTDEVLIQKLLERYGREGWAIIDNTAELGTFYTSEDQCEALSGRPGCTVDPAPVPLRFRNGISTLTF